MARRRQQQPYDDPNDPAATGKEAALWGARRRRQQQPYDDPDDPALTGATGNPPVMPVRIQPVRVADPTGWGSPRTDEGYARGGPVRITPGKASTRDYGKSGRVK